MDLYYHDGYHPSATYLALAMAYQKEAEKYKYNSSIDFRSSSSKKCCVCEKTMVPSQIIEKLPAPVCSVECLTKND